MNTIYLLVRSTQYVPARLILSVGILVARALDAFRSWK
jgi:hypothetical protein